MSIDVTHDMSIDVTHDMSIDVVHDMRYELSIVNYQQKTKLK